MSINFPERRLKYVATINDESLPETTPPDYELQYLDIGNVASTGEILDITPYAFDKAPSRARRQVRHGDVIISTVRTYLLAIAAIEHPVDDLIVSTGFAVIRARPAVLLPRFCKYLLREASFIAEVQRRSVGVSYPAVNASDLGDILVPVPTLNQQEAIADFLDHELHRLDQLAAARQQQLLLLEEKRRAIIAQAVTQGLDAQAPRRDSGFAWLGSIPAHWQVLQLKRVLSEIDYGISEQLKADGAIGVLRMGDIKNGEVDTTNLSFVNEVDDNLLLRENDLLFNRTNSLDQIGKVGLYKADYDKALSFASYLVRLRCTNQVTPQYLNFLLNSPQILLWCRSEALPSIGQANLNPNRYSYLTIALPPIEEQQAIVEYLQTSSGKISNFRAKIERSLRLFQQKRASLITAAVTGQLTLT